MDSSEDLLDSAPYMPHGHCYLWSNGLIGLHAISDAFIVLAYFSIPFTLVYFVRKRSDIEFHWVFVCFSAFILACGATHFMEIWNIWHANYWVSGSIKALTALASVPTSILLVRLVPQALALPSASQMHAVNRALQGEIAERKKVETRLRELNENLEVRVKERTAELDQSHAALKISEERFRLVVEAAPHAMVMANEQGRIVLVNAQTEDLFGYSRGELIGRPLELLVPERYHPIQTRNRQDSFGDPQTRGSVAGRELFGRKKDGIEVPIEIGLNPVNAAEGACVLASIIDISERKAAEEKLTASAKEVLDLKAALDEHSIVAITDPKGQFTYVNDKFCAISKYSREELLGQDHRIINSGFHSMEFIRDVWTTLARGRVWHGEIKDKAKDGTFYWVDTTLVPFLNPDGKPRQCVAIRTDITERKRAETAAAQLAAIVESSSDAIVGKDLNGIVTSWNNGAVSLFGYSALEMIGQSIMRLIPADRQKEEVEILAKISRGESLQHFQTERVRKDGSRIDLSITVSAIKDATGKVIGASKVARDISEQRRAEETIRKLNIELELRVQERTAQLESANHELEAFSYSVSHDLRAPLRAIDGFSQAVIEDFGSKLPEEGQHDLLVIRQSAQRMGALIDDLLAFARLNRQELNKRPIPTEPLVREILEEMGAPWKDREVDVRIGELPTSLGDRALLKQVWLNVLSNALKYTRKRAKAEIEIGAITTQGAPTFFVRDNGTGFDMRYAHKLFGVFQRLHRAEDYEGTGVGLAIVQRVVHRHGGRVWADATVDGGATFYFTLGEEAKP